MNRTEWFVLLALLGVLALTVAKVKSPRGIRNNNPGNLVRTSIPWKGKVPHERNTDKRFEQFISPEWGIRAMWRDVIGDIEKDGLSTPEKLINEYAPSHENNTQAYIASVSQALGIESNEPIKPEHYATLIQAIIKHENGVQPFTKEFIEYASELG